MENKEKVLEVKDLVISFKTDKGIVHAVRGVNFDLYKGETLCIVGESGSGKSVTNKAIMGISAKNAIIENGSILYEGEDLIRVSEEEFHRIRGHKIGMIFQDPLSALNPVMKVGKQIIEATMINRDILKRKYSDLISKELTEFRNNKANVSYNINRLENEIENNVKIITNLKQLNKDLAKKEALVAKLEGMAQLKERQIEKLNQTKEDIADIKNKKEDIFAEINEYASTILKQAEESTNKYVERLEKYNKLLLENSYDELRKTIIQNNIAKSQKHLDVVSNPSFTSFNNENIEASLEQRNAQLKLAINSYKEEFKLCNPALKQSLKISKSKAKIEVDNYYNDIKAKHRSILNGLELDLKKKKEELKTYEASLSEENKQEILKIVKYNSHLAKKKEKESKKFKEINVSKTTQQEETFLEIPNAKYAQFLNEIRDLEKKINDEVEAFINKTKITKKEAKVMALQVMKEVGIPLPERRFKQYPFEFSGGMRQRIVIAIALTANPDILICDEPTTALDVTIQAQILELINRLKVERHLSCIFITHDLGVVANMADRVAVMYAGKIVEYGLANEVFFDPKHPYTWALLSSIPDIDSKEKLEAIPGTPPDMRFPPKGDAFALRSKYAMAIDFKFEPPYFKISDTHYAATWLLYPGAPKVEMPKIVKTRIENALKEEKARLEALKKEEEANA